MKVFFRSIHLYLSLAAGLVIMVTCLTGAILVFEPELQALFHPGRYRVAAKETRVPLQQLVENTQLEIGKINGVKVYGDSTRSVEISYAMKKDQRRIAFVNPYTGELIEKYNHRESFFYWVMDLHRWMLAGDTGKRIVGISSSVFLFILITGLILWWPKTRKVLRQRLRIKMDGGWKRLNHDLHIVLGFYSCIFLFIFAFTGLAWSFEWFNKAIYTVTASEMKPSKPPELRYDSSGRRINYDQVLAVARQIDPGARYYTVSAPKDSVSPYAVNVLPANAVHESATNTYYIDPYTGKRVGQFRWVDRNTGQRVRATFKPIHVASLYGTPSRIVGFIVCLFGASFPVTGLILWINRLRKKKTSRLPLRKTAPMA